MAGLLAAVSGCAPYTKAPRTFGHFWTGLEVAVPEGWLRFNPENPALVITKDGLRLEAIRVAITRAGKKLKETERRYQPGMLPHEIAELTLALLEAREETNNFVVNKIELATLAGHDGYHATATFIDEQGLAKRIELFGAMISGYVCEFLYVGTEPIYYEKYLPAFQSLVASAQVKK